MHSASRLADNSPFAMSHRAWRRVSHDGMVQPQPQAPELGKLQASWRRTEHAIRVAQAVDAVSGVSMLSGLRNSAFCSE